MLKIDNLAINKELGRAQMQAVVGGTNAFTNEMFVNGGINANAQGGLSFASPQTNIAPVTQVDASQHTNVDLTNVNKTVTSVGSLIGGMKL